MRIELQKSFIFTPDGGRTIINGESGMSYDVPDDLASRWIADGRAKDPIAPATTYETKDVVPGEDTEAPVVKPKRRRRRKAAE